MSKGKLVAAIGVVAVVIIGAATYGYAAVSGGDRADAYEKKFDAWNGDSVKKLTQAEALPAAMFPVKGVKSYQDKDLLAAITRTCEETTARIKDVKSTVADLPTLSSNPLSGLNGDWKKAVERSDQREKAATAYADQLTELLERRVADCRFDVQYNQANPASTKAQKLIDAHDVNSGTTVPNGTRTYTCNDDQSGCIPVSQADLKPFLEGHSMFVKIIKDRGTKVGTSTYDKSSYKPAAAQIKAYFEVSATGKKVDVEAMRDFASDLDKKKLADSRAKSAKTLKAAYEKIFPALDKAYPGLADDAKVKGNPLYSEQFFVAIDALERKDLAQKRKALAALSD